jgi:signal transduction histidine kinase
VRLRSLRARLVAAAAGSILAALLAFALVSGAVIDRELQAGLDRALRQRAADVARLAVSAPAVLKTPGALEAPAGGRQVAVEVLDAKGRIVARSLSLGARLLPRDPLAERARRDGRAGYETISLGGRPVRIYAAPLASAGGGEAAGGVVLVASDMTDIQSTTHRLRELLLAGALIAGVLATLLASALTRRGLRPLRRLAGGAREIEATADVSRRLPTSTADDEVAELSEVLNRMLEALDGARAAERRFLADASHELRTPVTALLGNVEYAATHGASPDVLADLLVDARRLARLVDDLLTLERGQAEETATERVRLDEIAREAAGADPRVRAAAMEQVTVAGDREALARAARNLVDNALVHGPDGGVVEIAVGREDGRAFLRVRDEGPGPAEDERAHLFERFWRSPDSAGRPGSGLGLAIAASIADRHGGTLSVDGSAFTLRLDEAG